MKAAAVALTILFALATPLASADVDQTGTYVAFNPWNPLLPDCRFTATGVVLGLGGECFAVPADAEVFRVTLEDDVLGPGFGLVNFCGSDGDDRGCSGVPICHGVAEGMVREGTTSITVSALDPRLAVSFCGQAALGWVPTHGTITLSLSDG